MRMLGMAQVAVSELPKTLGCNCGYVYALRHSILNDVPTATVKDDSREHTQRYRKKWLPQVGVTPVTEGEYA